MVLTLGLIDRRLMEIDYRTFGQLGGCAAGAMGL